MVNDPVVEEIRSIRDGIAREYDYDISAIVQALMAKQTARGQTVVPAKEPPDAPQYSWVRLESE